MNKRSRPPLKSLVALESVVRHGSVTAAADELCVTHGAVSKHLAALEQWLGGRALFADNRRRMVPTNPARTLAGGVEVALEAIDAALDAVSRSGAEPALTVVAPATFAMYWLIPRLPDLRRSGVRFKVHVRQTHTFDRWSDLAFDLAIRSGVDADRPTGLVAEPLFKDRLGLLAAPWLARPDGTGSTLSRLTYLESETRPGELDAWLAAAGLARASLASIEAFEHNYVAVEAALSGQGAVVAPLQVLGGQIERGNLVHLAPRRVTTGPTYLALHDPNAASAPLARTFVRWLREQSSVRGGGEAAAPGPVPGSIAQEPRPDSRSRS